VEIVIGGMARAPTAVAGLFYSADSLSPPELHYRNISDQEFYR
jgi:hypothetical protein